VPQSPKIVVKNLTMAYGDYVVQSNLNFEVTHQEVFVVMGDSGCGKSTLMRHMIGLQKPKKGDIFYNGHGFWGSSMSQQKEIMHKEIMHNFGVMYQSGALWSSMTLQENVELPLRQYTELSASKIKELALLKLALVGLSGFDGFYPSEISGGMCKRAGIARAMALDPKILFFDEPSAGLDPISSKRMDDLILKLRDCLGTTVIVVTHELDSIFAIADNSVFLDVDKKTIIARGKPQTLLDETDNPKIKEFLTRGKTKKLVRDS